MSYKTVGKIEAQYPRQTIGLEILLSLNRELSKEESSELSQMSRKFIEMLRENSVLNSSEYKQEVKEEKEKLLACFPQPIYVKETPNEYNRDSKLNPWYLVTTSKGVIKIGWRKRVINIEWTKDVNLLSAMELFPNEDVTRSTKYDSPHYIHAWGYDKAKEYVETILK